MIFFFLIDSSQGYVVLILGDPAHIAFSTKTPATRKPVSRTCGGDSIAVAPGTHTGSSVSKNLQLVRAPSGDLHGPPGHFQGGFCTNMPEVRKQEGLDCNCTRWFLVGFDSGRRRQWCHPRCQIQRSMTINQEHLSSGHPRPVSLLVLMSSSWLFLEPHRKRVSSIKYSYSA